MRYTLRTERAKTSPFFVFRPLSPAARWPLAPRVTTPLADRRWARVASDAVGRFSRWTSGLCELVDASALADAYAVECEATRHVRPGWVPLGEAARVAGWRADNGWDRHLVGAFDGTDLVGVATAQTADDTRDTCWVDVAVHPRAQRQGVGMRLAEFVEVRALPDVTRFVASAHRPTAAAVHELVDGFVRRLGYTLATTETVVELDLERAELRASAPDGYAISTHVNGVPDHLREEVGVLKGLVDAEAPNGELEWQPTPVSEQEYADEIALWQQQGRTAIESVALDPPATWLPGPAWSWRPTRARPAQVDGPLVRSEHRGHRLGGAVKVAAQGRPRAGPRERA